jgi:hypothetical protein
MFQIVGQVNLDGQPIGGGIPAKIRRVPTAARRTLILASSSRSRMADMRVSIRRKDGTGPILLFQPDQKYLAKIRHQPDDRLATLSSECSQLPENKLFTIKQLPASEN